MQDEVGTLIEPASVPFTWSAPGWYVVGALLVLVVAVGLLIIYHQYRKNKYRRTALARLSWLERDLNSHPERLVYEATMLLKRMVMARYGRNQAAIRETDWITFLNQACKTTLFAESDAQWITHALYAQDPAIAPDDVAQFMVKTRIWIKRHRYAL
jgi:hypothetical protein